MTRDAEPTTEVRLVLEDDAQAHAEMAAQRRSCPVQPAGPGLWSALGHAEVDDVLRRVEQFVGSFGSPADVDPDEQILQWIPEPRHGRIRRVINGVIAPHRLAAIEPYLRDLTRQLVADAAAARSVDVVPVLIDLLPTRALAHLFGVPVEDADRFRRMSDELLANQADLAGGASLGAAHPEFTAYVHALVDDHRRATERPDDVVTRLLEAEIDGTPLSDVAVRTQVMMLIIAGNETTRNLLGNLIATLATRPDLYARLADEPTLGPALIDESLRYDPPVQLLLRTAACPVQLGPTALAGGDKVIARLAAANRDETVFERPDEFDPDRANLRSHLGFGTGPHVCPGAGLARLEARILLEELISAVARLHPTPGRAIVRNEVFWARGVRSLWLDLEPR